MKHRHTWIAVLALSGMFAIVAGTLALAQGPANELTYLTFSGPVEIPGQVLPAGTYQFRLADPEGDRNIIQVLSKDGSKAYAMLLTIPDERMKVTDKPTVTFEERAAGSPEAIRAFFYPGRMWGEEFVYPKNRAVELAKANRVTVPAMANEMAAEIKKPTKSMSEPSAMALKKTRLTAINPDGREVEVTEVILVHRSTK